MISKNFKKLTLFTLACAAFNTGCGDFERAQEVEDYNALHDDFISKYGHNNITHPDAEIAPDQNIYEYVSEGNNIEFMPLDAVKVIQNTNSVDSLIKQNKVWILNRRNLKDTLGAAYPKKEFTARHAMHISH